MKNIPYKLCLVWDMYLYTLGCSSGRTSASIGANNGSTGDGACFLINLGSSNCLLRFV